jgi:hypothetical protein
VNFWDASRPTYIENWNPALYALTMAQVDVPLTVDEAKRLGTNITEFGSIFCEQFAMQVSDISDIRARVAAAVDAMPNGAFVRLGSRSPKDSWLGHVDGFRVMPGSDPLRFMLDASERIYEDLLLAIQHDYPPHIWGRQWITIPPWSEFRCFMQGRKLVGISQYNYLQGAVFREIVRDHDAIQWVIGDQFFPSFRDASHLDDVVFDVWVKTHTMRDNTRIWEVKLVEINPFGPLTDPCLFAWSRPLDGQFRYNTNPQVAP